KLVDELKPKRSLGHSPLFQARFVLLHEKPVDEEVLGLRRTSLPARLQAAKFDLTLSLTAEPDGLHGTLEYGTDLFDRATIVRLAGHFEALLAALAEEPDRPLSQLPLLADGERHAILREWNDTESDGIVNGPWALPVHELFAAQAQRTPERTAVVWPGGRFTFAELDRRADRLARRLRELGVGPEVPVGVFAERSPELAAALLAVLKAGGAYLPLDPAYPTDRLVYMLADSRAPVLLTAGGNAAALAGHGMPETLENPTIPQIPQTPQTPQIAEIDLLAFDWESSPALAAPVLVGHDALAYLIYTSGSTGKPKGIALPHRTLSNLIGWQIGALEKNGGDAALRTLQFSSPSFDVSLQELFSTWCTGATIVMIDEESRRDPEPLARLLDEGEVERLFLPYVALQQLAEHLTGPGAEAPAPRRLREVVTAGERLTITPHIAGMFRRLPGCALRNHYGPSETHVVTEYSLSGDPAGWPQLPPIGRPFTNVTCHVLDRTFWPVPIGVAGELAIGGMSLARGYLNRPDLSADRFIPDPWSPVPGGRLYRSGDLARFDARGDVEFLGRIDFQV
ncbi:MAG TPA: amino acid adenylation domain-containing protein, partial [Thermoanaerobaculia bacterium]